MGFRGGGVNLTPHSVPWFSSTPAGIGLINKFLNYLTFKTDYLIFTQCLSDTIHLKLKQYRKIYIFICFYFVFTQLITTFIFLNPGTRGRSWTLKTYLSPFHVMHQIYRYKRWDTKEMIISRFNPLPRMLALKALYLMIWRKERNQFIISGTREYIKKPTVRRATSHFFLGGPPPS